MTLSGGDVEWRIQTDEDRRALAAIEALRSNLWAGEQSRLAVSQAKAVDEDDEEALLAAAGLPTRVAPVAVAEAEDEEGEEAEDEEDAWDSEDVKQASWGDLWAALEERGWRQREGGGYTMPPPELGEPRAFDSSAQVRAYLRSFPHLLSDAPGLAPVSAPASEEDEEDEPPRPRGKLSRAQKLALRQEARDASKKAKGGGGKRGVVRGRAGGEGGEVIEPSRGDGRDGGNGHLLGSGEGREGGGELGEFEEEEHDDGVGDAAAAAANRFAGWSSSEEEDGQVQSGSGGSGGSGYDQEEDGEEDDDDDEEAGLEEIDARASIFDASVHGSVEAALADMVRRHGFFLPEAEYISDLEGLLRYCHEKVPFFFARGRTHKRVSREETIHLEEKKPHENVNSSSLVA